MTKSINGRSSCATGVFAVVVACVCLLLNSGCAVDVLTPSRFVDFDFDGPIVKVSNKSVHSEIDFKLLASAGADYGYNVIFVNRSTDFIYAVIEVSGHPGANDAGDCANGVEQNVVWIKLDKALHVVDSKSVLVESCTQNVHNLNGCAATGDTLIIRFTGNSFAANGTHLDTKRVETTLRYDNTHPEAGLAVASHELASIK